MLPISALPFACWPAANDGGGQRRHLVCPQCRVQTDAADAVSPPNVRARRYDPRYGALSVGWFMLGLFTGRSIVQPLAANERKRTSEKYELAATS